MSSYKFDRSLLDRYPCPATLPTDSAPAVLGEPYTTGPVWRELADGSIGRLAGSAIDGVQLVARVARWEDVRPYDLHNAYGAHLSSGGLPGSFDPASVR